MNIDIGGTMIGYDKKHFSLIQTQMSLSDSKKLSKKDSKHAMNTDTHMTAVPNASSSHVSMQQKSVIPVNTPHIKGPTSAPLASTQPTNNNNSSTNNTMKVETAMVLASPTSSNAMKIPMTSTPSKMNTNCKLNNFRAQASASKFKLFYE